MKTMINTYKKQQANSTDTMNLLELVASLLDKTASHIQAAKKGIDAQDYEKRVRFSNQASDILLGLSNTLEYDTPEKADVSRTLKTYYEAMNDLIHNMNIRNDAELCSEIEKSLKSMAIHWREMDRLLKEQENKHTPSAKTNEPCYLDA